MLNQIGQPEPYTGARNSGSPRELGDRGRHWLRRQYVIWWWCEILRLELGKYHVELPIPDYYESVRKTQPELVKLSKEIDKPSSELRTQFDPPAPGCNRGGVRPSLFHLRSAEFTARHGDTAPWDLRTPANRERTGDIAAPSARSRTR
jgi:hypothetical protein